MLAKLIINAIAFYVVSRLIPGVRIVDWTTLLVVAVVWGVITMFLRPILIVLTLPVNFVTLGLFTFVINALLLLLTSRVVPGFEVDGFVTALMASILLAILNMFLGTLK
jgi:putative membrane protein